MFQSESVKIIIIGNMDILNNFLERKERRTILFQSFDFFISNSFANYRFYDALISHTNASSYNVQNNVGNDKDSIKYGDARSYGDNRRIQFVPTDNYFNK